MLLPIVMIGQVWMLRFWSHAANPVFVPLGKQGWWSRVFGFDLTTLFERKPRPWPFETSFPMAWMILSCVMLTGTAVAYLRCGLHAVARTPRSIKRFHDRSRASGRYGLGPKPGTRNSLARVTLRVLLEVIQKDLECKVDTFIRLIVCFVIMMMSACNFVAHFSTIPVPLVTQGPICAKYFVIDTKNFGLEDALEGEQKTTSTEATKNPVDERPSDARSPIKDKVDVRQDGPHSQPFVPFDSLIRLVRDRPQAMNCTRTEPDFDPEFLCRSTCPLIKKEDGLIRLILDTGASFSITPDKDDFASYQVGSYGTVETVTGPTEITGFGIAEWTVISEHGERVKVSVPAHHIPESKVRLLSPQDFCLSHGMDQSKDQFGGNSSYFWMNLDDGRERFQCPIDPRSNLPIALAKVEPRDTFRNNQDGASTMMNDAPTSSCKGKCGQRCSVCISQSVMFSVAEETNQNITQAQKELLLWHWRLGHIGFELVQRMISSTKMFKKSSVSDDSESEGRVGCIEVKHALAATCPHPVCAACKCAKGQVKGANVDVSTRKRSNVMNADKLVPGQEIHLDQYESAVRGRLPTSRGRESFGSRYCGGTIGVDVATGMVFAYHQTSLRASETIKSKRKIERSAKLDGHHNVQGWHSDNGVFKSKEFMEDVEARGQKIDFSGVGAKHQNGKAERAVRTVTEKARAMMQHSAMHWPDQFNQSLWPFALDHAVWLHNHTPVRDSGLAPVELWRGQKLACGELQRARVWGCPVYVLDPKLQDGKKIPKWAPRSKVGQYLGFSAMHSSTVGLVRNLRTESVSAQFHLVFDELFSSIFNPHFDQPEFLDLFRTGGREYFGPDEDEELDGDFEYPVLDDEWLDDDEQIEAQLPTAGLEGEENDPVDDEIPEIPDIASDVDDNDNDVEDEGGREPDREEIQGLRRSRRNRKPATRWTEEGPGYVRAAPGPNIVTRIESMLPDDWLFEHMEWDRQIRGRYGTFGLIDEFWKDPDDDEVEWSHPLLLSAKANSEDTPGIREVHAMPLEEQERWYAAMDVEIEALTNNGCVREFPIADLPKKPDGRPVKLELPMWQFVRKRRPDGTLKRYKARMVLRGDLQELPPGVEGNTYAPVVDWGTVRLLFTLLVKHNLKSVQVDFRNAFTQSDLDEPIYMHLPPGFKKDGMCYQVNKQEPLWGYESCAVVVPTPPQWAAGLRFPDKQDRPMSVFQRRGRLHSFRRRCHNRFA